MTTTDTDALTEKDMRALRRRMSPEERFWSYADKGGDCWMWTGGLDASGYGQFTVVRGEHVRAHRHAYALVVGPIPEGKVLDHLCRTRACVNPAHMEPVTNRENVLRGDGITALNARKTHCPAGHEYTEGNTYLTAGGKRQCRQCNQARTRKAGERKFVCPECGAEGLRSNRHRHARLKHGRGVA